MRSIISSSRARRPLIVVAPATADFLSRAASGRADDLLAACLLAADAPVLLVPAMNDRMWAHRQTAANVAHLRSLGYTVLEPEAGPLASPHEGAGAGRMPEPERIFAHVGRMLEARGALAGRRVLVTAGPTREALDPVRFLSNHSSGKMGVAVAAAAWRRGADVTLVAGPLAVAPPRDVSVVHVESTERDARRRPRRARRRRRARDGRGAGRLSPEGRRRGPKIKKATRPDSIALENTDDILATTRDARKTGAVIVGLRARDRRRAEARTREARREGARPDRRERRARGGRRIWRRHQPRHDPRARRRARRRCRCSAKPKPPTPSSIASRGS